MGKGGEGGPVALAAWLYMAVLLMHCAELGLYSVARQTHTVYRVLYTSVVQGGAVVAGDRGRSWTVGSWAPKCRSWAVGAVGLWAPYSSYCWRWAVGAVGGVCGPPPSSLLTPFTALLLTGDFTVTGVQLDVAPWSVIFALFSSVCLLARTGGVQVSNQCVRKVAGKGGNIVLSVLPFTKTGAENKTIRRKSNMRTITN